MADHRRQPVTDIIEPAAGFAPGIGHYITQLSIIRSEWLRQVQELSPTQLSRHPDEQTESIGTQILHVAAIEWSWIFEDILGRSADDYPGSWHEALPIRVKLPQVTGQPLTYYLNRLEQDHASVLTALKELSDADLPRLIKSADSEDQCSIDWILFHLVHHEAHHAGQIELLVRLLPTDL